MTITLTREEAQQVLDALWRAVSTCFDQYSHEQVMSNPKHFINQTIETLRSRLSAPEPEQTRSEKMREAGITRRPKGWSKEDEPEPVAWVENLTDAQPHAVTDLKYCSVAQHERGEHLKYIPLYADPTPCQTCEALARTVMMDQTSHDTTPPQREWQGLTDEEVRDLWSWAMTAEAERTANTQQHAFARAIEAKLKEKNT